MLRRFILVLIVAWTIALSGLAAAWGEDRQADNGRGEVIAALVDTLKENGTITAQEQSALKERAKPSLTGKDLEEVAALLRSKGVIGDEEEAEIESRIHNTSVPGGDIEATVEFLRVQGIVSGQQAEELLAKLSATPLGKEKVYYERVVAGVTRELRKQVEGELKKEIREEAVREAKSETKKSFPDWLNRFALSGDLRLQYEGDFFDQNNAMLLSPSAPTTLLNTTQDRNRMLVRARLNVAAQVNDQMETIFGLATGTTSNPVSERVTLGDYFNKLPLALDLAYLKYVPNSSFIFWGGRFPSPWLSTDLVWWPDLRFDGIAGSYLTSLTPRLDMRLTAGAFALQEVELSSRDKYLFGGQTVFTYKAPQVTGTLGIAFYDYENVVGEANDPLQPGLKDFTAPLYQQKGNTVFDIDPSSAIKTALASDFRELNVTAMLDLGFWDPVHVDFIGDYVRNLGFDRDAVAARTGNPNISAETTGYQVGVTVGHPSIQEFGDWKGFFFYKYLQADAVLDAFTDPDFHLGGTNAKGWIVGGELGLKKNFWLSARWMSSDEISGPPLAIDVFQLSLNARF